MACDRVPAIEDQGPEVEVVIEIPRLSFLKRGSNGRLDFISPFPCPFNYGSVPNYVGLEGDLLDAVVLGPRLKRNARVTVRALGAIGLRDRGLYDDKLICGYGPLTDGTRAGILLFFRVYGLCKQLLNAWRGRSGVTRCEGWVDARLAIRRCSTRTPH